jgi:hypothetical protein
MYLLLINLFLATSFNIKHRFVTTRLYNYNGNNDDKLKKIDDALNSEKIKMKQVEEEYYKADEKTAQTPTGNHISTQATGNSQDLYPPSPDQPLSSMSANIPDPVKDKAFKDVNTLFINLWELGVFVGNHRFPKAIKETTTLILEEIMAKTNTVYNRLY